MIARGPACLQFAILATCLLSSPAVADEHIPLVPGAPTAKPQVVPLNARTVTEEPTSVGGLPSWAPFAVFGGVVVVIGGLIFALNRGSSASGPTRRATMDWDSLTTGAEQKSPLSKRLPTIGCVLGVCAATVVHPPNYGKIDMEAIMLSGVFGAIGATVFGILGAVISMARKRSE